MAKATKNPFFIAAGPMTALGIGFAAVGLSGQPAFGYTGVGLLIPGVVLLATALWTRYRRT